MSVLQTRGGIPKVLRDDIDTGGRKHKPGFITNFLQIRVSGNPCRLFFTADDFDNDVNYVEVPVASASTPYGEWQGPVEAREVWLKGVGGVTSVELVTFQRRG